VSLNNKYYTSIYLIIFYTYLIIIIIVLRLLIFFIHEIAYGNTGSNVMIPYPAMPAPPSANSNPPTTYHGSSTTPYPLYNNQFPTPTSYPTGSANTANFPSYTSPYPTQNPTQNCPYPQQPASIRPEYPPYPGSTVTSTNTTTGVSMNEMYNYIVHIHIY